MESKQPNSVLDWIPGDHPGVSNEGIHDEKKYTTCIAIFIPHVGTRLKWSVSRPGRFNPRRKRRWVGPQRQSGLSRKEKDLWPLPGAQ
jgi:hypothetical protein